MERRQKHNQKNHQKSNFHINKTFESNKKKQKNKKTGQTRVITKEVDEESFFNFFKSVNITEKKEDEDVLL